MGRLKKLSRLAPADLRLLAAATLWLTVIRLGMWLLPFATLRRRLARTSRATTVPTNGAERPFGARVLWAVMVAGRFVPRSTCLARALAAQAMLARQGRKTLVRIGVAPGADGRPLAHAWLEEQGTVILGGLDSPSRFATLLALE